ncbi:tumor protein p53-inducible protein 13 isoform X3 [Mesocricetus auratus]|uniref:Tumor protein p53-inducible protein 13 isoform X3 n=1 Tax=Mesocricetus auratus TaxID=10036 RepID=A0ABM2XQY3_MESAU|nr:tumor protein p53-inducible protein 13 isoform X3 [Mesocricetus auratus]
MLGGIAGPAEMVPPPSPPPRLLLVALVGLLSLCESWNRKGGALAEVNAQLCALDPQVVVELAAEEAGTGCPEGLWPLPPQVLPRVTYTQVGRGQLDGVAFLYHPCAHPWLKLQLALLAHVCVAKPTLVPDSNLTSDRPLVLTAWGTALEMAWVEPAWVANWLKRRRRRRQQRKSVWFLSDTLSGPVPMMAAPSRGKLCGRRCVQAPTLAFALRSWRPPGVEVTSRGSLSVAKRRGLRAALRLQSTPSGLRVSLTSSQSPKAQQPILGTSSVAPVSLMTGAPGGNARSRTEAQKPSGQDNPEGCACPGQASPAPRAAAPPRVARGPTPRTEEAAWAAMALTFLLVLLTLATLCTRLHRNFRRSESIYWGPTADSQDTVAAVLKRRLPLSSRRIKRSRRRPLLPPTPDSGPDSESSD